MIKCLQNSCLDKEIEDVVYGKKEDFSTEGLIEIWNKVEQLYRKKVSQSLKEDSKLYDDDDIHVFDFVSNSIYLLKNTPTFIKNLMSQLLADIEKSQENLKSEKNERKTKRNKWMNSQRSVKLTFNQLELKCKRLIKEIIDHLNSSNNKIDGAFNEKEQQLKDFEKKLLIIPVNQRKQPEHGQALAKIRHDLNEINKFKKVKNNHNNANMKIINEFQNRLTLYSSAAHNFVKTAPKLVKNDFISPKSFYLPRPRIVTTQKGGTINGGCLVNFSKVPYIRSTTKSKVQLDEIRSCIKNKNQEYVCCSNDKKGFAISLNIVPLFNDGIALQTDRMKDLVRSNDKFLNNMTTAHLSASLDIVDCLKKLNNRQLNEETSDRKTPAYLACETGNLLSIHTLIDKKVDFSRSLPNGIYPFLVAMANGHHDAAMLLLTDKNVKIGDINRSTETGVGPLQWAIFYNYPDIVKLLLERGASVTDTLQSNGMTPVHLACFHNRIECLVLLLNEKDADYGPSKAGITPLQYAIVHSPNCARFLIKIGKSNLKAKDPRGYTMRDIALMNGQFETAQLLPKGGKLEHLIKQNKNSLNNSINLFKSICYALETGNISNAEKLFKNLSKRSEKTVFNREQKKKMIENACLGRKPEFVELLSKVMNFNYYPIALYAARHGLVDWILEIQKYGGNLLCEEDGETIFDIAVENSDHEFLTKAFKIIENIPEKIIIRIVKRSIKINDDKTIYAISNSLLPEMKNYCLLSPSVILIRETTPYAYFIYQQNLDTKIKLNLNDFVESLSPNLISFLLSQCEFDDEDLKISCLKALNDSRSDIAYVIIQKNPSLVDKIAKDKRYSKITSLTTDNLLKTFKILMKLTNDPKMNETDKISKLKNVFKTVFDIGDLIIENNNTLAEFAGKSIKLFWLLKALPKRCLKNFYLSEEAFNEGNIEALFRKELEVLESFYVMDLAGSNLIKSLKKLNYSELNQKGLSNEFVSALVDVMKVSCIDAVDDDNNTIFHVASRFGLLNEDTIKKMINAIKNADSSTMKNIINARNRNGESAILLFAASGNFEVIKYLVQIGANIKNRDISGENILHKILNAENMTNDKVILIISRIIHEHPDLIIQTNNKGESPFMVAASKGFNGVIGIMSLFYPISILDSSENESVLHLAAKSNYPDTIRYLVQTLQIDVNIKNKDGLTPLHYASQSSSLLSFKELLDLGGNPLIPRNNNNYTSIDYALLFGSEEMVDLVMKTYSFNYALSSPQILANAVINPEAYSAFVNIMNTIDPVSVLSCDENGNNLISAACMNNNRNVVVDLLLNGCDPEKVSFNGQHSLHVCAEYGIIGCAIIVLKFINDIKGPSGLRDFLHVRDLNGDLPIHIAARKGFSGFITQLLSADYDYDPTIVNNAGYTALAEALKKGHKKVASILTHHWMECLNETKESLSELLNIEVKNQFEELLSSDEFLTGQNLLNEIKRNVWKYKISPLAKKRKQRDFGSRYGEYVDDLKKIGVNISRKFKDKCSRLSNNFMFLLKLYTIAKNESVKIANEIVSSILNLNSTKIRDISCLIILPRLKDGSLIKKFVKMMGQLDELEIHESHPLFAWIENGLISIAETILKSDSIIESVKSLIDLILLINGNEELMNKIEYPILPCPVHVMAASILKMNKENQGTQLKFISHSKCSMLTKKKPLLSFDFCNRAGTGQNILFDYVVESKFDSDIIERVIEVTLNLYENPSLFDNERELILNQCKLISSKDESKPSKSDFGSWVVNSVKIIETFGFNYYNKIIPIIPQSSLQIANKALAAILTIDNSSIADVKLIQKGLKKLELKAEEIKNSKFIESRDLDSILQAFNEGSDEFVAYKFAFDGTPVVKLSKKDLKSLKSFGTILEKQTNFANISEISLAAGRSFHDEPTIENAAKLVGIVRQVVRETFGLNPFIVQCLTVGSILLHRVNKKNRSNIKWRIAQVATGEGKSIIIAMLAGCVAITGDTVDVISSSSYLAERDAEKFKPFYQKLGLRCGTVYENNNNEESFDYHILYSTNTGFEFALLREGISGKSTIQTTLLFENTKRQRPRMTAIVDEADNLFIDTAMNSARIAQGGTSKQSWIFKPIFEKVSQKKCTAETIRNKLLELATPDQIDLVNELTDEKLTKLIKYANKAIQLKRGIDYVVGRNKRNDRPEILIVDANNTGRIMHESRWSNGLHEFVEVKEGLEVREQSLTVASISHPSFFELYDEIFGLTGTLGEVSEREEIKDIYHIDTFDVPPNRKCLRKRENTLIVRSEKKKNELIIKTIVDVIGQKRPILVIVRSIVESQKLSDILRMQKIKHFVLNDQQPQDEDFIIDLAGKPKAVTIATNTAGRGTDIRIDDIALKNGGLHTLITFFPSNLRVECQALGRSGRQGQPGSCQIIFASEEFGKDENSDDDDDDSFTSDETLRLVYEERSLRIKELSEERIERFNQEKEIFEILKQYFAYIKKMTRFLDSAEAESLLKDNYPGVNSMIIKNKLQESWAEFFSEVAAFDIENPSFDMFL